MNKPYTLIRQEYMENIVNITNACPLPAVFKADVLENALQQLRKLANEELKRDMDNFKSSAMDGNQNADKQIDEFPILNQTNIDDLPSHRHQLIGMKPL